MSQHPSFSLFKWSSRGCSTTYQIIQPFRIRDLTCTVLLAICADLVSSGCGYLNYFTTAKKYGVEKVSRMIDNGVLYFRPLSTLLMRVEGAQPEADNVLMATGAPAMRAMELLLQNPIYSEVYGKRAQGGGGRWVRICRRLWPWTAWSA